MLFYSHKSKHFCKKLHVFCCSFQTTLYEKTITDNDWQCFTLRKSVKQSIKHWFWMCINRRLRFDGAAVWSTFFFKAEDELRLRASPRMFALFFLFLRSVPTALCTPARCKDTHYTFVSLLFPRPRSRRRPVRLAVVCCKCQRACADVRITTLLDNFDLRHKCFYGSRRRPRTK